MINEDEIKIMSEVELSAAGPGFVSTIGHIHTPDGRCVKRRMGPKCEKGPKPAPPTDNTKHEIGALKEDNRQLRLEIKHLKNKIEEIQIICGGLL